MSFYSWKYVASCFWLCVPKWIAFLCQLIWRSMPKVCEKSAFQNKKLFSRFLSRSIDFRLIWKSIYNTRPEYAYCKAVTSNTHSSQSWNQSITAKKSPFPATAHVSTAIVSHPSASLSPCQLKTPTKCPPYSELERSSLQKASKSKHAQSLPNQTAATRTFSLPSTNQGFRYLYLSIERHLPINQLRFILRRLYIYSSLHS